MCTERARQHASMRAPRVTGALSCVPSFTTPVDPRRPTWNQEILLKQIARPKQRWGGAGGVRRQTTGGQNLLHRTWEYADNRRPLHCTDLIVSRDGGHSPVTICRRYCGWRRRPCMPVSFSSGTPHRGHHTIIAIFRGWWWPVPQQQTSINVGHDSASAERRTQNTERRTQNAEHRGVPLQGGDDGVLYPPARGA